MLFANFCFFLPCWVFVFYGYFSFVAAIDFHHLLRSTQFWVSTCWDYLCRIGLLNSILSWNCFHLLLLRILALSMLWSWNNLLWKGLTIVSWVHDRQCHMIHTFILWIFWQRLSGNNCIVVLFNCLVDGWTLTLVIN